MKKIFLIAVMLITGITVSQAQNPSTWGVRGGFNFPMNGFSFEQAGNNINSIFLEDKLANGWHAGIYGRAYLSSQFYVGANLLYLNRSNNLTGKTANNEDINQNFNSSGSMLDLVGGIKVLNLVRVQGGLNGMVYFDNSWQDTFNTFGAGYTFGVGVDIWKFALDVSYYGSFKEHQGSWNGIPLSYNRSDLLVSLGIAL